MGGYNGVEVVWGDVMAVGGGAWMTNNVQRRSPAPGPCAYDESLNKHAYIGSHSDSRLVRCKSFTLPMQRFRSGTECLVVVARNSYSETVKDGRTMAQRYGTGAVRRVQAAALHVRFE